jgi:hypothetical protein
MWRRSLWTPILSDLGEDPSPQDMGIVGLLVCDVDLDVVVSPR